MPNSLNSGERRCNPWSSHAPNTKPPDHVGEQIGEPFTSVGIGTGCSLVANPSACAICAAILQQVIRREVAEAFAEALAKQAQPDPVGALTATQTAKFLGYRKTRFHELLHEYPELEAIGVVLKITRDGRKIRRWPVDGLKAWLARNPQVLAGSLAA